MEDMVSSSFPDPGDPGFDHCDDRESTRGTTREVIYDQRPVASNVELRSVDDIDEKYRHVFSAFQFFNVIQSLAFDVLIKSDDSVIVTAPTGSGKTVIFELAIIRLLENYGSCVDNNFKIVYVAPIKALCSERFADWKNKFLKIGLNCIELTGDSEEDIFSLDPYHLILTTPEKWDSLTRKWRENNFPVQKVKLFMIDEVHLLNEEKRGPTLEAVVCRMKLAQSVTVSSVNIRFIAVSATIPNVEDITEWLSSKNIKAHQFQMSEESRPVKLKKVVIGYPVKNNQSPFMFDLGLDYKLKFIIPKYAEGKPTLIFCSTRKGVLQTGKTLANDLSFEPSPDQRSAINEAMERIHDGKLKELLKSGIGCHHAGIDYEDRRLIEGLFRSGCLPILVATSTLAMGINLPAHLVIIKSTEFYIDGGYHEYSESQVLQMIGRAGRPQFDVEATAVIMTKDTLKKRYENVLEGIQPVESNLHRHLTEHLNAEVVLRTIPDIALAMDWMRSTFLYIRTQKNPAHYKLSRNLTNAQMEFSLQGWCQRELNGLVRYKLASMTDGYDVSPTPQGSIMAQFCISFETMKLFTQVGGSESLEDLLRIFAKAEEFKDIKLRMNERSALNSLNKKQALNKLRFPIKGKIQNTEMKVNCLIQAHFGCLPLFDAALKQDVTKIIRVGKRLAQGLVQLFWLMEDNAYRGLISAILFAKCFTANLWEDSVNVSRQLPGIGPVLSQLLVSAKKETFSDLLNSNPRDIEMLLNRNPPFGNVLIDAVKVLPQFELELLLSENKETVFTEVRIKNPTDVLKSKKLYEIYYFLIGNSDSNRILHKSKFSLDSLMKRGGSYCFSLPVDDVSSRSTSAIVAHVISKNWVGLDISQSLSGSDSGRDLSNHVAPKKMAKQTTSTVFEESTCSKRKKSKSQKSISKKAALSKESEISKPRSEAAKNKFPVDQRQTKLSDFSFTPKRLLEKPTFADKMKSADATSRVNKMEDAEVNRLLGINFCEVSTSNLPDLKRQPSPENFTALPSMKANVSKSNSCERNRKLFSFQDSRNNQSHLPIRNSNASENNLDDKGSSFTNSFFVSGSKIFSNLEGSSTDNSKKIFWCGPGLFPNSKNEIGDMINEEFQKKFFNSLDSTSSVFNKNNENEGAQKERSHIDKSQGYNLEKDYESNIPDSSTKSFPIHHAELNSRQNDSVKINRLEDGKTNDKPSDNFNSDPKFRNLEVNCKVKSDSVFSSNHQTERDKNVDCFESNGVDNCRSTIEERPNCKKVDLSNSTSNDKKPQCILDDDEFEEFLKDLNEDALRSTPTLNTTVAPPLCKNQSRYDAVNDTCSSVVRKYPSSSITHSESAPKIKRMEKDSAANGDYGNNPTFSKKSPKLASWADLTNSLSQHQQNPTHSRKFSKLASVDDLTNLRSQHQQNPTHSRKFSKLASEDDLTNLRSQHQQNPTHCRKFSKLASENDLTNLRSQHQQNSPGLRNHPPNPQTGVNNVNLANRFFQSHPEAQTVNENLFISQREPQQRIFGTKERYNLSASGNQNVISRDSHFSCTSLENPSNNLHSMFCQNMPINEGNANGNFVNGYSNAQTAPFTIDEQYNGSQSSKQNFFASNVMSIPVRENYFPQSSIDNSTSNFHPMSRPNILINGSNRNSHFTNAHMNTQIPYSAMQEQEVCSQSSELSDICNNGVRENHFSFSTVENPSNFLSISRQNMPIDYGNRKSHFINAHPNTGVPHFAMERQGVGSQSNEQNFLTNDSWENPVKGNQFSRSIMKDPPINPLMMSQRNSMSIEGNQNSYFTNVPYNPQIPRMKKQKFDSQSNEQSIDEKLWPSMSFVNETGGKNCAYLPMDSYEHPFALRESTINFYNPERTIQINEGQNLQLSGNNKENYFANASADTRNRHLVSEKSTMVPYLKEQRVNDESHNQQNQQNGNSDHYLAGTCMDARIPQFTMKNSVLSSQRAEQNFLERPLDKQYSFTATEENKFDPRRNSQQIVLSSEKDGINTRAHPFTTTKENKFDPRWNSQQMVPYSDKDEINTRAQLKTSDYFDYCASACFGKNHSNVSQLIENRCNSFVDSEADACLKNKNLSVTQNSHANDDSRKDLEETSPEIKEANPKYDNHRFGSCKSNDSIPIKTPKNSLIAKADVKSAVNLVNEKYKEHASNKEMKSSNSATAYNPCSVLSIIQEKIGPSPLTISNSNGSNTNVQTSKPSFKFKTRGGLSSKILSSETQTKGTLVIDAVDRKPETLETKSLQPYIKFTEVGRSENDLPSVCAIKNENHHSTSPSSNSLSSVGSKNKSKISHSTRFGDEFANISTHSHESVGSSKDGSCAVNHVIKPPRLKMFSLKTESKSKDKTQSNLSPYKSWKTLNSCQKYESKFSGGKKNIDKMRTSSSLSSVRTVPSSISSKSYQNNFSKINSRKNSVSLKEKNRIKAFIKSVKNHNKPIDASPPANDPTKELRIEIYAPESKPKHPLFDNPKLSDDSNESEKNFTESFRDFEEKCDENSANLNRTNRSPSLMQEHLFPSSEQRNDFYSVPNFNILRHSSSPIQKPVLSSFDQSKTTNPFHSFNSNYFNNEDPQAGHCMDPNKWRNPQFSKNSHQPMRYNPSNHLPMHGRTSRNEMQWFAQDNDSRSYLNSDSNIFSSYANNTAPNISGNSFPHYLNSANSRGIPKDLNSQPAHSFNHFNNLNRNFSNVNSCFSPNFVNLNRNSYSNLGNTRDSLRNVSTFSRYPSFHDPSHRPSVPPTLVNSFSSDQFYQRPEFSVPELSHFDSRSFQPDVNIYANYSNIRADQSSQFNPSSDYV